MDRAWVRETHLKGHSLPAREECRRRSELTPLQQRMNSYTSAQRAELGKSALALIAKAAKRGRAGNSD